MKISSQTLRLALCLTVTAILNLTLLRPAHALVHPGISHTQTDLDRMKNNVNVEPYKTAYQAFKNQSASQFTNLGQGPYATVTYGSGQFEVRNDARVCRNNAIMWYVTGDVRFRDNAIRLMNAWANTLTSFEVSDHISAGGSALDFCNAAEIIRSSGGGAWTATAISKFQTMLVTHFYPPCLTPGNSIAANALEAAGHGGLQIKGLLAIGIFCDRQDIFNFGVQSYQHSDQYSYGLTEYIHSSGQNYETQRDQGHASGNISAFATNAAIVRNQGVDLFGLSNNLLAKAFESQAKINLLYDVAPVTWTAADGSGHNSISPDARQPFDNLNSDLAYSIFNGVKGLKMPYTKISADVKFPDGGESFLFRIDNSGKVPTKPLYGEPSSKDVVLFGDGYFSGSYLARFGPGNYNAAALLAGGVTGGPWGNGTNTVSSLKVPNGWTVTAYDGDNFTGSSVVFTADNPNLGAISWSDRLVSMKVQAGGDYKVSDGTYKIVNLNSGKVADVSGASLTDGGDVLQWPYSGANNQLWRVEDVGNGQYMFININSGKVMEVLGASLANGTASPADPGNVNQWSYSFAPNIASGGTATASSTGGGGGWPVEAASNAFDGNIDTKWGTASAGSSGWLQYQFPTAKTVIQYRITSGNDRPERDPSAWQLQGSNNGSTWVTLDTRSGQTFAARSQSRRFDIASPGGYTYYRLNITANIGGSSASIQLTELGFYSVLDGGPHQRWTITGIPGSTYGTSMTVKNVNSGKVLNVFNSLTADGANIIQSTSDTSSGGLGQKWLFQTP